MRFAHPFRTFLLFVPLLAVPAPAQFTPAELAERPKWEAFLRASEVVSKEQLSFEQGVTEPWQLTLKQGGVVRRALWKDATGVRGGYLEGWRYEVAAYVVDKLIGLGMVPPTVTRVWEGRTGSCQLWIDGTALYRDQAKKPSLEAEFQSDRWKDAGYRAQFFDDLIGNEDRHQGNVLVTRDTRAVLIDHSRTFRIGPSYTEAIPFSEKTVAPEDLMRRLPRALVERTAALDEAALREALRGLLSEAEIRAVLARRELLLRQVRRIVERLGEANVLY